MQNPNAPSGSTGPKGGFQWGWLLAAGVVLVLLIAILTPRSKKGPADSAQQPTSLANPGDRAATAADRHRLSSLRRGNGEPGATAEEIVANKVNQFARNRREILHKWAEHLKLKVPAEYEKFFDLAEAGNWDELHDYFGSLTRQRKTALWPVVLETFGVAEIAHRWPAQQLLDYGQSVLGSLRPDMVYVGGTDPGRYIPTLLNETSEGARHIVLTQNALADSLYLSYLQFQYSDRLNSLTLDDSQNAFRDYVADAQKRLLHDQQFPDEPKQIRPGESVLITEDGKVEVSGKTAVMAINELLVRMLMEKNPELSFAIEQSFPLKSMYADTSLLGPIMELRAKYGPAALTPELAAQSVEYWRTTTPQLLSNLAANDSLDVRKAYGKMIAEQAALLLDHKFPAQAEENFRLAIQIHPSCPEAVVNYVQMLMNQGLISDAATIAANAAKAAPDDQSFRNLVQQLQQVK